MHNFKLYFIGKIIKLCGQLFFYSLICWLKIMQNNTHATVIGSKMQRVAPIFLSRKCLDEFF